MTDLRLHRDVVDAFCAGRLPQWEEAELAVQVARIYTCEPQLPNLTVSLLGKLTRHLGGGDQVLVWMARFPGEPALVATVLRISDLLGALSGNPTVVEEIRRIRRHPHRRDPLAPYWAPTTDHVTLSDLAETLKHMLRKNDGRGAIDVSNRVLDLLSQAFHDLARAEVDVTAVRDYAEQLRAELAQAGRSAAESDIGLVTSRGGS